MKTIRHKLHTMRESLKHDQTVSAQKGFMEELFNDYYLHRRQVYKMNFFRGIFFGLGSVLGGTILVALVVWLLSLFVNFPLIGHYLQNAQQTIDSSHQNR